MKMNGIPVTQMNAVTVVINRGQNENPLVADCKPVVSYDAFNKICVIPTPPEKILKGGAREPDFNHPTYLKKVTEYSEKRVFFLFLESVKDSIEWETVKLEDSDTWKNCETEMKEAGLTDKEVEQIFDAVFEANAMNEDKLNQARKAFLAGREDKQGK